MVRKILLIVAFVCVMLSLVSCGTVQGLGGDIQWVGEKGAEIIEGE